jgi:hypothetical protein
LLLPGGKIDLTTLKNNRVGNHLSDRRREPRFDGALNRINPIANIADRNQVSVTRALRAIDAIENRRPDDYRALGFANFNPIGRQA